MHHLLLPDPINIKYCGVVRMAPPGRFGKIDTYFFWCYEFLGRQESEQYPCILFTFLAVLGFFLIWQQIRPLSRFPAYFVHIKRASDSAFFALKRACRS